MKRKDRYTVAEYAAGIIGKDRRMLSLAVTLVESALEEDQLLAEELVDGILSYTGNSLRIGITGVPGVGKSTFIDRFGTMLVDEGHRVAVLTIDPSSKESKGSILGDKTRMERLGNSPHVFIRPSAASGFLGGVSAKTRESSLLCEAAGYNIIIIETVGVGQSETAVKGMVDFLVLLALAGAGDELQGIKKGIMEIADLIVINKADGGNSNAVEKAKGDLREALHYYPPKEHGWRPDVVSCSSVLGEGLENIWTIIKQFELRMKATGFFDQNRSLQRVHWMNEQVRLLLEKSFYTDKKLSEEINRTTAMVQEGEKSALSAARILVSTYLNIHCVKNGIEVSRSRVK